MFGFPRLFITETHGLFVTESQETRTMCSYRRVVIVHEGKRPKTSNISDPGFFFMKFL